MRAPPHPPRRKRCDGPSQRTKYRKEAAARCGMAAAFSPDALPQQRCHDKAPTITTDATPRSSVVHKLSVRKRTLRPIAYLPVEILRGLAPR